MLDVEVSTGATIRFAEAGAGAPLVLLYGAGGHHRCWEPQIEALAAHRRLILPDMRGAGGSRAPAGDWALADYAADVAALLDALDVERADVVGMSMGGAIALELMLAHPRRVGAAVLMNTWARTDARLRALWEHVAFLAALLARAAADPALDAARHERDLLELNLARFFSPSTLEHARASAEAWWEIYAAGYDEEGGAAHFRSIMRHDVLDALPRIEQRILVLGGEEDYFTPYYSRQLAAGLPNGSLTLLEGPGAGHGMHWERPEVVNREILGFLGAHLPE